LELINVMSTFPLVRNCLPRPHDPWGTSHGHGYFRETFTVINII